MGTQSQCWSDESFVSFEAFGWKQSEFRVTVRDEMILQELTMNSSGCTLEPSSLLFDQQKLRAYFPSGVSMW